jgi:alanyl-tRNA synthetase
VGFLTIEGVEYVVKDCEKVGKAVLHILEQELPQDIEHYVGVQVQGRIDIVRRRTLRNHHTATHIVFAACRQVLGPHVWQNGAKKTIENAHLDITHYSSLSKEKELEIENAANRIILQNKKINKSMMDKVIQLQYIFNLFFFQNKYLT